MIIEDIIKDHHYGCEENKKKWKKGKWTSEPNRLNWVDKGTGLECMIIRNRMCGFLCGYVGVKKNNKHFGVDHEDFDFNVHGGVGYSGYCYGVICHIDNSGEKTYWFGFDCAHLGDFSPISTLFDFRDCLGGTYKDIDYVKRECLLLASQLFR